MTIDDAYRPPDANAEELWDQVREIEATQASTASVLADAEQELAQLKLAFERVRLELGIVEPADGGARQLDAA